MLFSNAKKFADLAVRNRIPSISSDDISATGRLIGYGVNNLDFYIRAAAIVDKILKGTKPSDLPVERPTTFELVVNLKTAKAMSVTIPQSILLRADKVIE